MIYGLIYHDICVIYNKWSQKDSSNIVILANANKSVSQLFAINYTPFKYSVGLAQFLIYLFPIFYKHS